MENVVIHLDVRAVRTHRGFSITQNYTGTQDVEWAVSAELQNEDPILKTVLLGILCNPFGPKHDAIGPKHDATVGTPDETSINTVYNTSSINEDSSAVFISVGVSLGLSLLIVTAILAVVFRRKARACVPRSARQSPVNDVTFRQVPFEEQADRSVVVSDDSHHAYIEVKNDSDEPGISATGKATSNEAADSESDGYLQPYTSPMSGANRHRYSSLATRRTKPDDHLNPIQPASESTAAARTTHSDSPYEIA